MGTEDARAHAHDERQASERGLAPLSAAAGGMDLSQTPGPIVFLDIDGVLNRTISATHIRIEEELVDRLRAITAPTGAGIVLTTFWRQFDVYIAYILGRHGIRAPILGRTPGLASSQRRDSEQRFESRSAEILAWLAEHASPGFQQFVVIDDRDDAGLGPLRPHFVQTDPDVGLSDSDVERALAILRGELSPVGTVKELEKGAVDVGLLGSATVELTLESADDGAHLKLCKSLRTVR